MKSLKTRLSKFDRQRIWESEQEKLPGIFIPVRAQNPLNNRRSWRPVWRASKRIRSTVLLECRAARLAKAVPVTVVMTRYGPQKMDEGCGLNASLKPVRDGVADHFEIDDADPRFRWVYQQEIAPFFGVRIETLAGAASLVAESAGAK